MKRNQAEAADTEPATTAGRNTGPAARACILLFKTYKSIISPFLPPSCRFTPTCSQYAIDAVTKRGVVHGIILTGRRLLRCHPLARGGYDPVE